MANPVKSLLSLAAILLLLAPGVRADSGPVGLWNTFDEDTGKPKAQVRITEEGGTFTGRIVRLLDPADPPDSRCEACPDDRRGQPLVGLAIIRNVRLLPDPRTWGGGEILDPEDGKIYRLRLKLAADNRHLEVRGYIGTPLIGRSQTWQRAEEPPAPR